MVRRPLSRLLCAGFILLMSGGGGDLPALDGLLFHGREPVPLTVPAHFEASGGCHADQCPIRSTAQQSRLTSAVASGPCEGVAPESIPPLPAQPELRADASLSQPFSRAPPILQS